MTSASIDARWKMAIPLLFVVAFFTSFAWHFDVRPIPQDHRPAVMPFNANVGRGDWPQLGGTPSRNNVPETTGVPIEWNIDTGKNLKWSAVLGSQSYGNIVVANGRVFVGTNNTAGYIKRYPSRIDLGVLLCFRESDGEFLWQYSSPKLPTGRVHDWPYQGICSAPVAEGDLIWFVSNRGEVVCLDAKGFRDGQNDGPFTAELPKNAAVDLDELHEADVVWKFDMMRELGVHQHNMATCSPTIWGDVLFVCTSNGVNEGHFQIPAPDAPSFVAMDKRTGNVLWTDNSPGKNILHGQWSSPAVGVFQGVPQVLFPGGDGWLYSFRADRWADGKPEFLWKFDGNPKDTVYKPSSIGRFNRTGFITVPVIYDGLVYFAMGEDPEHGEGPGHLWCVNPNKRGDVSPELVVDDKGKAIPHQRFQATALIGDMQPRAVPNSNSAVVWHYASYDLNGDKEIDWNETMHRSIGSPVIKYDLLFITDHAGLTHCLNAKTGVPHWTHELFATCWTTPLIAGDRVYVTIEDSDVTIFSLSKDPDESLRSVLDYGNRVRKEPKHKNQMTQAIYMMPVVANNVLFIAVKDELFAIQADAHGRRRTREPQ
jgi:outer membrane protein assembly factor BamB